MSLPRTLLATLCLVALALTGCSKSDSNSSGGDANIRVVNAFFEATSLDFNIAGSTIATALPFQGLKPYQSVNNGVQTFLVTVTGASTPLVNASSSINGGADYTYVVFGPLTSVGTILAADGFNDPGSGFYAVRVMNTAAGIGPIDVYLTPPGADLTVTAPTVPNVAYGATTVFFSVATGGNFEIRITPSGTKQVIFDSAPKPFPEHSGTTILAYSKGSGTLVNVAVLNSGSAGGAVIVDNLVAQYKVINASQAGSPLNIFIDGALQLSNIPYLGVSNYQQTAAGAHAITVQAQATPGATLLTLNPDVVCRDRYVDRAGRHRRRVERSRAARRQPAACDGKRRRALRQHVGEHSLGRCLRQFQQAGHRIGAEHRIVVPQSHGLGTDGHVVRVRFQHRRYGDVGAQVARRRAPSDSQIHRVPCRSLGGAARHRHPG